MNPVIPTIVVTSPDMKHFTKSKTLCRNFVKNKECKFKNNCRYTHKIPVVECRFKQNCRFSHANTNFLQKPFFNQYKKDCQKVEKSTQTEPESTFNCFSTLMV